jgi:hypothetical protein
MSYELQPIDSETIAKSSSFILKKGEMRGILMADNTCVSGSAKFRNRQ